MKSLFIIIIGVYFSWQYTDLASESTLNSVIAPIGLFVFIISLCLWLVLKAGFGSKTDSDGGYSGGDGGDF